MYRSHPFRLKVGPSPSKLPPLPSGEPTQIPGQHSAVPTLGGHTHFRGFPPPGSSTLNPSAQLTPKDSSQQIGVTYTTNISPDSLTLDPLDQSASQVSTQQTAQESTQQTSQDSSQQSHVFTQRGVTRTVQLDDLLYLRSVLADLIKSTQPSSSLAKKDMSMKEWEKYTLLAADLSLYNLEKFKLKVVANLGKGQMHFHKLLESLISRRDVKWQGIISSSQQYGPKKFAFLAFYKFVEAVYKALNSKERSVEENLMLAFEEDKERIPLEREVVRLAGNPKANISPNPVTPKVAKLMQHIVAKWGRNDEKYWIGNLKDQTKSMQITQNLFPIWAQALLHNHNPEVSLDHPPATKAFVWIKKHTPKLDELNGNPPDTTNDVEPPKSPSVLPNIPLGDYPRDPSPLPENPLKDLEKGPSPAPPAPSSDIEVVQGSGNPEDTSYKSPIALDSSQPRSPDGTPLHMYARSPRNARSPTGDLIGDAIQRLSVQRGSFWLPAEH
ncbi:hypothetical protein PCANC_07377 [Puccinia coronata f. sp. avenae]|uniref:Uncharacterized protein n=1 Tax=Puccinia coronata f. sp. avenae TaxID=200324 RepID=A0A2N5T5G7_9BASI|nr:hypothetical protein PCANC_07377 [Puccinia coronata f. sp. avenae]